MNAIERHYRLLTLQERIEQLVSELVVITTEMQEGPEQDRLQSGEWYLMRAAEQLARHATPAAQQPNLERMLELSIRKIRRERQVCEEVGGGVPATNEKGLTSANVSPFLNRQP